MIKKFLMLLSCAAVSTGYVTFLTSCAGEDLLSLEYEEGVSVQFLDPCGNFYMNASLGYLTEYNGVTYRFAKELTEEERNRTVTETAACLEILESKTGSLGEEYSVYIACEAYTPFADGNNLYFGYKNIKTAEFATAIVQLVYGREVNYGVLYGLGASIAQERGYKIDGTDLKGALSLYDGAPEYLDLNYACFLDDYADKNTLKKVKTLSKEFYSYLELNGKTDLLTDYSDEKRRSYFNNFLSENGKGEYNASDLDGILFYGGGNTVRLTWASEYVEFNLCEDFDDYYKNGSLGASPLNCGYADLRMHIVNFEAQTLYIRERLSAYNDAPDKVTVNFDSLGSYFDLSRKTAHVNTVFSVMHEYIHSVINGKYGFSSGENSMVIHSLVYYFSRNPVNANISYEIQVEQDNINGLYGIQTSSPEYVEFVDKFTAKTGHKINLFENSDYVAFYDNCTKYFKFDETLLNANSGYAQVSFGNYLVANYGEVKVCEAAFGNSPERILGKPWGTIIAEWRAYLDGNYIL